ncbi:VanW family protein [Cellulosimicrobium composti]|uniref:VanW family protein n=1 Tax=Cellulosimicrobium composti TaxID=2672572 RepID=UPI0037A524F5
MGQPTDRDADPDSPSTAEPETAATRPGPDGAADATGTPVEDAPDAASASPATAGTDEASGDVAVAPEASASGHDDAPTAARAPEESPAPDAAQPTADDAAPAPGTDAPAAPADAGPAGATSVDGGPVAASLTAAVDETPTAAVDETPAAAADATPTVATPDAAPEPTVGAAPSDTAPADAAPAASGAAGSGSTPASAPRDTEPATDDHAAPATPRPATAEGAPAEAAAPAETTSGAPAADEPAAPVAGTGGASGDDSVPTTGDDAATSSVPTAPAPASDTAPTAATASGTVPTALPTAASGDAPAAATSGDAPTAAATSGTAASASAGAAQAAADDDEPYVPRVFAFDPDVPAVLVPPPGGEQSAATSPEPAGPAEPTEPASAAGDRTAVVPVVPPQDQPSAAASATPATAGSASGPAGSASGPAGSAPVEPPAGEQGAADATQVIPPVAPWTRPEPVVRTSIRPTPATDAPTAATPASAATPAGPAQGAPAQPAAASSPVVGSVALPPGTFGPVPPDESRQESPFEGFEEDAPRRGWVRGLLWTGVGVLVLGGLYTGAQWFFSDKVPSGTSVAGVDVGGLTRTAAQERLEAELGPRAAEPVTLAAGEASTTLDPATAGLTFDAAATAEELTAFSMSPARLWQHLFGGQDEAPVVTVDDAALDAQVETLRGSLEIAPVDGTVQFVDGAPTSTPAADGSVLVADEVPGVITSSWLVTEGPVELPTEPVEPAITQDETDAALAQAQKVVSAPVVVSVGGQSPELPPEALAAAASFPATDGVLSLTFDGAALVQAVVDRTNDLLTAADDAHFVFRDGVPVIEGGAPGTTIDPEAIAAAVTTAASGDERTATVELVESDPEQSVAALEALGVTEKVAEFSTPVPNVPVRTANLRRGAEKVTGTLVKPGETFSLVDTLSPITIEGGYFAAGIVESGRHTEGVGGGLSQMATTTYNAAFFAGLEDVEHRPHSYWFDRYPAGREATIFVGSIDMKFKNDTPYGVLMQSWVGGGQLHVAIWSTKYYDVETSSSGKSNVVQPTTVTHSGADCAPTPAGSPGFSITNYRKVYLEGELVKDESYRWTYKPDNAVVCE